MAEMGECYVLRVDFACTGNLNIILDLIHHFVIKNVSANYITIKKGYNLNSDYSPILLTIDEYIITKDQNPVLINKYSDWDYFNFLLKNSINMCIPHKTIDQLEEELCKIPYSHTKNSVQKHTHHKNSTYWNKLSERDQRYDL